MSIQNQSWAGYLLNLLNIVVKKAIYILVSTVIAFGVIFHFTSLENLWQNLLKISISVYLVLFFVHLSAYLLRTLALYFLAEKSVRFNFIFQVHLIHNFIAQALPLGAGEFSLPFLLRDKLPFNRGIALLFASKLLLVLSNFLIFTLSFLFITNISLSFNWNIAFLCLACILLSSLLLNKMCRNKVKKSPIIYGILLKIFTFLDAMSSNIKRLKPATWLLSIVSTFLSIISISIFYFILLNIYGISLGLSELAFFSSIGIGGLIIPIKSVGGFGTVEGLWVLGLTILGISGEKALDTSIAIHSIAFANQAIFFLIGLLFAYLSRTTSIARQN